MQQLVEFDEMKISKNEFKEKIDKEFFIWVGSLDKRESSWLLNLIDWANIQYNKAYNNEKT